ncbi:hypothetical protein T09_15766, partial [Trichinella sp. T9]
LRSRLLDSISSAFSTSSALAASAKCPRSSLRCYSAPSVLTAAIYGKVVAAGRHRRGTIKTWDMNGTFKLLFIHAIVVSKLVPVVCCYVRYYTLKHTNRNEKCWICAAGIRGCRGKLYTNLVATQYSDITPGNTIICDFETALIPAIRGYFPNTRVQGCYFHFCQAVHRKVGELGLKTRYRTEEPTKRKIRMLLATAFLPVPHVNTGVSLLEAGTTGNLSALFQYFRQEWMTDERLPLWNVYNVNIRTNNHLEGWHNRLNRKAGKSHNGLYELLQLLISEQGVMDTLIQQVLSGNATVGDLRRVNKVYAQKQRQVARYTGEYTNDKAAVLEVDLNPDTIICDFETALIPAIRGYFPNTRVQGCYFHFCQAVHRKVGELGLKTRYRTEEPTKRKIRMLLATAFLPVPHVNTGVSLLEAGTTGNLSALFQYFRQEGMIDERLPLWNVYNVNIRTNNHLEGWYNRLNRKAGKSHNGLYELLQLLIDTLFSKYYQETLPLVNKVYAQKQRQVARVYGNADHEKV